MNLPNRYLYVQHDFYSEFSHLVYWRLLYRTGLLCAAVFAIVSLIQQNWLQQASYFSIIDITALIIIPWLMAELILRRDQYSNKRWNHMILLASLIIGLSALGIFY
ncbi:hypothetical protein [Alkanindiges illinoisensis]|uniref:hypothetical protein n=1 Tax=Alkanindiges illinoisensis TaxID=197183 RepID=UPI00047EEC2D|nr:hypothetical protein [Alkanindiges illinoisensis]